MILIVEDDARLARAIRVAFRDANLSTEIAANGVDAYRLVARKDCKCVLLDINMPMIDGREFLALLTKKGFTVPVIVMTGAIDVEPSDFDDHPNVVAFASKPFDPAEIVPVVQSYL